MDEKASNFFPNTDFEGKPSKEWYPRTSFPEEIEIPRMRLFGEKQGGIERLHLNELPIRFIDNLEGAFTQS